MAIARCSSMRVDNCSSVFDEGGDGSSVFHSGVKVMPLTALELSQLGRQSGHHHPDRLKTCPGVRSVKAAAGRGGGPLEDYRQYIATTVSLLGTSLPMGREKGCPMKSRASRRPGAFCRMSSTWRRGSSPCRYTCILNRRRGPLTQRPPCIPCKCHHSEHR